MNKLKLFIVGILLSALILVYFLIKPPTINAQIPAGYQHDIIGRADSVIYIPDDMYIAFGDDYNILMKWNSTDSALTIVDRSSNVSYIILQRDTTAIDILDVTDVILLDGTDILDIISDTIQTQYDNEKILSIISDTIQTQYTNAEVVGLVSDTVIVIRAEWLSNISDTIQTQYTNAEVLSIVTDTIQTQYNNAKVLSIVTDTTQSLRTELHSDIEDTTIALRNELHSDMSDTIQTAYIKSDVRSLVSDSIQTLMLLSSTDFGDSLNNDHTISGANIFSGINNFTADSTTFDSTIVAFGIKFINYAIGDTPLFDAGEVFLVDDTLRMYDSNKLLHNIW